MREVTPVSKRSANRTKRGLSSLRFLMTVIQIIVNRRHHRPHHEINQQKNYNFLALAHKNQHSFIKKKRRRRNVRALESINAAAVFRGEK